MTDHHDVESFGWLNLLIHIYRWILKIVVRGIVVFKNVGVFAGIDGGNFVGVVGDFTDGFGQRLLGFLFGLEGEVVEVLVKFFLFLLFLFFLFLLLFVFLLILASLDLVDSFVKIKVGKFKE
jgi:hypothetical protein